MWEVYYTPAICTCTKFSQNYNWHLSSQFVNEKHLFPSLSSIHPFLTSRCAFRIPGPQFQVFWFPEMAGSQLLPGFQLPVPTSKLFQESEIPIFFHGVNAIWTKFFVFYSDKPGPALVLTSTICNSAARRSFALVWYRRLLTILLLSWRSKVLCKEYVIFVAK